MRGVLAKGTAILCTSGPASREKIKNRERKPVREISKIKFGDRVLI